MRGKKKLFFIKFISVCFFIIVNISNSNSQQNKEADSFLTLIENHPEKDSIRVDLLLKTAYKLVYGNSKKAFDLSREALQISEKLNDANAKYKSNLIIGMAYYRGKSYSKALESNFEALKIADSLENDMFQSMAYGNIANIYADFGKFNEALKNYNLYLKLANEINNPMAQIEALTNIGVLQTEKDSLIEKGILNLKQALIIAKKQDVKRYIANIKLNLGLGYRRKNDFKTASKYYNEVLDLSLKINDKFNQLMALNNLCTINVENKEFNLAEINANKTLKLAEELEDIEWQSNAWVMLSKAYTAKNNPQKALEAFKKHIELKDSLDLKNTKAEILKIEENYLHEKEKLLLNAKHEKEILLSKQEISHQKSINSLALISALILVTLMLISFLFFKRKQETQFNLKVAETELKALRAQMNPHFIFNSLNSIGKYTSNNNKQEVNSYLSKFSRLMRQTLENSEKKEITIEEDLELLKTYLDIETKRFSKGFKYQIKIDPFLDTQNLLIPPMMLQPFVENSIWHGISKMNGDGFILIEVKKEKNKMIMYSVDDNGVGIKNNNISSTNKTSMGIKIIKNRIDIINKNKKANASLEIIDKEQGTRVELKLPLETLFTDD